MTEALVACDKHILLYSCLPLLASWKCKGNNCNAVQYNVVQWQESMRKKHKLLSADLRKGN